MAQTGLTSRSGVDANVVTRTKPFVERKPPFRAVWQQHWMMYLMLLPAAVLLILFHFYPLWGIAIAFVKFNPFKGLKGSEFVGLKNFERFFSAPNAGQLFRNTLVIAIGKIISGQLTSIIFALTLHQVRIIPFKRAVQTATTLPHFLSWVIIGGVMVQVLSSTGIVNTAVKALGLPSIKFLSDPVVFPFTIIFSEVWKEFGWGAVIYLAALTSINPELYEAAAVDGAGRWRRLLNITIPGITPTIVLLSCLSLGGILNAGFEQILVLINPVVYATGDIIDTFVYRVGLLQAEYSLGAAVGLFRSIIGFVLILLSYWLAAKFANYRIF